MSKPSALITGGGSGIGQALAEHLVKKGWKVTIADINEANGKATAESLGPNASFVRTDVTDFDQQVAMFKHAFAFGGNRLDFFAANAGIADTQEIYDDMPLDVNGDPTPLNLLATEINLISVIQGAWLYKHYASKNPTKGGKLVMTSSVGGLYASPMKPQYNTSKHGIVGLARSLGGTFLAEHNITVNALCPNLIFTQLAPQEVKALWPKERLTPMSTALKAYDQILDDGAMTGKVFELITEEIIERHQIPFGNKNVEWNMTEGTEIFKKGYAEFVKNQLKLNGKSM